MAKGRKLRTAAAAASSTAAKLTEDMITEILVKLPVKSLLRFRCVCKSWLDLIKSPNFIDMHLKHHHSNSNNNDEYIAVVSFDSVVHKTFVSFYSHETLSIITSLPKLEIPHLENRGLGLQVCGPCNGLICISDETNIVLCNPLISEFKLLPLSPCLPCPDGSEFDRESIGFGFDSYKKDYKVVTFICLQGEEVIVQIEIYNLSTNSWVEYQLSDFPQHIDNGYRGTLFDGSFYWVTIFGDQYSILSYDMSIDEFNYTKLPDRMLPDVTDDSVESDESFRYRCIRVINDCLAVLMYTQPHEDLIVEVWVMLEFGETSSITKKYHIGPLNDINVPLLFCKNEALLVKRRDGGMASYALDTHEVNDFDTHGWIFGAVVYQGSLVSIK